MADVSSFDLVVIGAGPAGEKAAAQAAFFRKKVLVIESEPDPGGAAVHTGTLPSKTLRETALYLSGYRSRALYGLPREVAFERDLRRGAALLPRGPPNHARSAITSSVITSSTFAVGAASWTSTTFRSRRPTANARCAVISS